ncbi:hypothetical protein I302_104032 [Kwoniella bestiolae CBS 10118]|uniref:Uncharacterized protein n=1 Tax=Kwoniella bestiolae CBS 10118 TaxID=1296100 RepID=A0A1B9GA37_9TREE|nr:hypothetical protein I302_02737 [Kwoniella bestiolae CBS 10118]OCF27887.1 hypothetical protein I302_02737 [Kwoniella bestiolae CBS 10118]
MAAEDANDVNSQRCLQGLSRSSEQDLKVDDTVHHLMRGEKWKEMGLDQFTNHFLGSLDLLSLTNKDKSTLDIRMETNGLVGQTFQALQDQCELLLVIETEDSKEQENTWWNYSPMSDITQAWDRFKQYTEETWKGKLRAESSQSDSHPIEKSRKRLIVADAAFCPASQSEHHKDEYGLYLTLSPICQLALTDLTPGEGSMGANSQMNSIDVPVRSERKFRKCIALISEVVHSFQDDRDDAMMMHASVGGFDVVLNRCSEEKRWEVHMLDECSAIEGE